MTTTYEDIARGCLAPAGRSVQRTRQLRGAYQCSSIAGVSEALRSMCRELNTAARRANEHFDLETVQVFVKPFAPSGARDPAGYAASVGIKVWVGVAPHQALHEMVEASCADDPQ